MSQLPLTLKSKSKSISAITVLLLLTFQYGSSAFSNSHIERRVASGVSVGKFHPISSPLCSINIRSQRQKQNQKQNQNQLMSSLENNNSNGNGKQPKKKRERTRQLLTKLNPIKITLSILQKVNKIQSNTRTKFKSLSKKGKVLFSIQIMTLMILFGTGSRQLINTVSRNTAGSGAGTVRLARVKPVEIPYSTFMDMVEKSGQGHTPGKNPAIEINDINIGKDRIAFRLNPDETKHEEALTNSKLVQKNDISTQSIKPRSLYTTKVDANPDLIKFLRDNQIPFRAASKTKADILTVMSRSSILIIYMLFLVRMYKTMAGGGGGAGDTPGKLAKKNSAKDGASAIQFKDIEGIDEAKFEVMELVDSLRNPGKYSILGARAPRGCLLEGPPGTGKTMLARACAGAAAVPLLYCSGSDFVEMFVGRGAARVRKTFERAGKIAPCIIFIDELDALGKSRGGNDMMGMQMRSNDEAEQTLNQLLACMDGLDSKKGICVLAATNRREVLDQALIRPGRFDRIIKVTLPDVKGRERILRVHAEKLPGFKEGQGVDETRLGSLGKGDAVDLSAIASITAGLSGAELEFIVNEAAIRAVRRVSAAIREGKDPNTIDSPHVNAMDFQLSVKDFFDTRRPNKGSVGDVLSNVFSK